MVFRVILWRSTEFSMGPKDTVGHDGIAVANRRKSHGNFRGPPRSRGYFKNVSPDIPMAQACIVNRACVVVARDR